jgi:hypothetical protein
LQQSQNGPTRCGKARSEIAYLQYFIIFLIILHINWGGVHIGHIFLHICYTGHILGGGVHIGHIGNIGHIGHIGHI